MSIVRSPVRSVVRSPVRGVFGAASLIEDATSYLANIAPYHWFDFINDRCLYASNDVGGVSGATGYSFSRASTGYYTNADGTLTSFASGALRRGDRGVLIEGARTNLLTYSTFAGGGSTPTGWTQPGGTGTSTPVTSTLNAAIIAYEHTATAQRPYFQIGVTLASNTTYVLSVYVEAVTGTISLDNLITAISLPSGCSITLDSLGNLAAGQRRTLTLSGTYTGAAIGIRVGLGASASATGTVRFSAPQLEAASFPSSYIPTTTASATRASDVLTFTPGVNWPLSLWVEFIRVVDTGTFETLIRLDNAGSNLQRSQINIGTSDDPTAFSNSGGSTGSVVVGTIPVSPTIVRKAAARFAVNNVNLSVGGANGTADTSVNAPTAPDSLIIGADSSSASQFFNYIRRAAVFNSSLVDANLLAVAT